MATKTEPTKRPYSKSKIKEAAKNGEDWRMNMIYDNDVLKKIISEKEKSKGGCVQYGVIVNNRLRKAYGLKTK